MQQSDLKDVAELFEKVAQSDKVTQDDSWQNRFQEFCDQQMKEHASRLKLGADTGILSQAQGFQKQEVWRARYQLYGIVEERLDDVLRQFDRTIAEVAKELRVRRLNIFQEVCADLASLGVSIPDEPISLASSELGGDDDPTGGQSGGIAAFANARRRNSEASSEAGSMAMKSVHSHFAALSVNAKAYDDALSDSGDGRKASDSPNANADSTTLTNIYGTVRGQMSGPALLGAGPQDYSGKPALRSISSYTTMHKARLSKKKSDGTTGVSLPRPPETTDLSLRQLRDVIDSVYSSKRNYDAQCQRRNMATTTLEKHLYEYLKERYEVKASIQEWCSAIFKAVQKYSPRESYVAVFGKVLQNTMAESFTTVQDTLQRTISDLLMNGLKDKYPSRPQSELASIFQARVRCGFPLSECSEVVKYMYNEGDAEKLLVKLSHVSKKSAAVESASVTVNRFGDKMDARDGDRQGESLSPDSVRLKDLEQLLLSFQMSLTEAFLKEFVEIFREIDTDQDGILKFKELEELVRRIGYVEELEELGGPATVLLEAKNTTFVQVQRCQKGATFSECVDMFTSLISARWGALNP